MRFAHILFLALACSSAHAQTSMLYFSSPPGDFVGQGTEGVHVNGEFSVSRMDGNTLELAFRPADGSNPWNLSVSNRELGAARLAVGDSYKDAMRFPFEHAGRAGLAFSGDARGCNQIAGAFKIRELAFDGTDWHIAIDFAQRCEAVMPALKGQWRYRSSIPVVRSAKGAEPAAPGV